MDNRSRVIGKIERIFECFQVVLQLGGRPTFYLPDNAHENIGEIMELCTRNTHRFLYVSRILLAIYERVKTNTYQTTWELYEEHKNIFMNGPSFLRTLNWITHLLRESRVNLHLKRGKRPIVARPLIKKKERRPPLRIRLQFKNGTWRIIGKKDEAKKAGGSFGSQ